MISHHSPPCLKIYYYECFVFFFLFSNDRRERTDVGDGRPRRVQVSVVAAARGRLFKRRGRRGQLARRRCHSHTRARRRRPTKITARATVVVVAAERGFGAYKTHTNTIILCRRPEPILTCGVFHEYFRFLLSARMGGVQ